MECQMTNDECFALDGIWIHFVGMPEGAAFHAAGGEDGLAGEVAGQLIRTQKDGEVRDVVGTGDLRQGHGGGDFADGADVF